MADDKRDDGDDEKTVIEPRSPARPAEPAPPDDEKTMIAGDDEVERTMFVEREPAKPARPPAPEPPAGEDATMIAPRGPSAPPPSEDATRLGGGGTAPGPARPSKSEAAFDLQLVCLSGDARGRRLPVPEGEYPLGSDPSCTIVVPGTERSHVRVIREGQSVVLRNLGSPGSLQVRGRATQQATLRPGELAKIGEAVVRLVRVGDVFSTTYSPSELSGGGLERFVDPTFLKENPRYVAIGALVLGLLVVLALPAPEPARKAPPKKTAGTEDPQKAKRVQSLLAAGEVLFNAGKLLPPDDRPDAETALAKFNEVLVLDPGNEAALEWLSKLDEEHARLAAQRSAEEERDRQARLEAEERERQARLEAEERDRQARLEEEQRQREAEEAERQRHEAEMNAQIEELMTEADRLFESGQLIEPVGRNALAYYRRALEIYPESERASAGVDAVIGHYVNGGDKLREKGDLWGALESYRRGLRAFGSENEAIQARIAETEQRLRSGMPAGETAMIMWRDASGKFFVVDDRAKVPASAADRAVEIPPAGSGGYSEGY